MKKQRWPMDNESISQEFARSKRQEQEGMDDANKSHGNDFLLMGMSRRLDSYNIGELEPSASMQLDTTGMHPHSREYLERCSTNERSARMFHTIDGQTIDYCEGIHFGDTP